METTTLDLTPQTDLVARIVAGVRDDQLGDPTPDDGTSVAGLLDHLVGLTTAFTMAARKEPVTGAPRASADQLAAAVAMGRASAEWERYRELTAATTDSGR